MIQSTGFTIVIALLAFGSIICAPATPSTKPSTPPVQTPIPFSSNQTFIQELWKLENAAKVGWDNKTQRWIGNKAPEAAGGTDYGPGLKLTDKKGGYTQQEIDAELKKKLDSCEQVVASYLKTLLKTDYKALDFTQRMLLVDYQYNVGISNFPKFTEALVKKDIKGMKAQYKRHYTKSNGKLVEILGRNQWTLKIIEQYERDLKK